MLKAKVLCTKPDLNENQKENLNTKGITIVEINRAIKELNLDFKQINEVDIYNIFQFILKSKKR